MDSQPLHIRPATVADIPDMLELERQCPTAAHWSEHQYLVGLREHESGLSGRLVLIVDRDAIAGSPSQQEGASALLAFLIARHLRPEWELENLVVAPSAQRRGLGGRLLGELFARAWEAGSESIFLEVRESNGPARALYEKSGFLETGRRQHYYRNPTENAILYRRTLL